MPDIPLHIFSPKIRTLSHSHFIRIEIADFPTVSPIANEPAPRWFPCTGVSTYRAMQFRFKQSRTFFIIILKSSHSALCLQSRCWSCMDLNTQYRSCFRLSQKKKTQQITTSAAMNFPAALTVLWLPQTFPNMWRKEKEKLLDYHHRRNCSLITNRTPLSQELKGRATRTTFPHHFALKYGVGRTNWCEQV